MNGSPLEDSAGRMCFSTKDLQSGSSTDTYLMNGHCCQNILFQHMFCILEQSCSEFERNYSHGLLCDLEYINII